MKFLSLLLVFICSLYAEDYFLVLTPQNENYEIAFVYTAKDKILWLESPNKKYFYQQKDYGNICPMFLYSSSLSQKQKKLWSNKGVLALFEVQQDGVLFTTVSQDGQCHWKMNELGNVQKVYNRPEKKGFGQQVLSLPLVLYKKDNLVLKLLGGESLALSWQLTQDNLFFSDEWSLELPCQPLPERFFFENGWILAFHKARVLTFSLSTLQQYSIELMLSRMKQMRLQEMSPDNLHKYVSYYYISQEILRHAVLEPLVQAKCETMLKEHARNLPLLEVNLEDAGKVYRCLVSLGDRKARFLPTHLEFSTPSVQAYIIPEARSVIVWDADVQNALIPEKSKSVLQKLLNSMGILSLEEGIKTPFSTLLPLELQSQMNSLKIYSFAHKNRLRIMFFLEQKDYNLWKIYMKSGLPLQFAWASHALGLAQQGKPSAFASLSCQRIEEVILNEKYTLRVDIAPDFWETYQTDSLRLQIKYAGSPQHTAVIYKGEIEKIIPMPLLRNEKGEPIYSLEYRWDKYSQEAWKEGLWETTQFPAIFLME
ncbi:MAG: hypothetical protein HUU50_21645 [Candidatus Brocadiae bacterium]|nr:hypothetical protein [Candidatus Brocadiia bacterium]